MRKHIEPDPRSLTVCAIEKRGGRWGWMDYDGGESRWYETTTRSRIIAVALREQRIKRARKVRAVNEALG